MRISRRRLVQTASGALAVMSAGCAHDSDISSTADGSSSPLSLHPDNPHYFLFRGRPTVLVGSSEHYGAVINRDFNYVRYLDALYADSLNVTRIFTGQYRERPGLFRPLPGRNFEIVENTLAPNANAFIAPWPRSDAPGAGDGRNKFDLSRWNDEYFERLVDFCAQASRRGIVVEVCLFCPYYIEQVGSHFWDISPWNARNNINGVGDIEGISALSLGNGALLGVQEGMVTKIASELSRFDNIYYDICNEPTFGAVPLDWQAHIARLLAEAEAALPRRHLILQEFVDPQGDLQTRGLDATRIALGTVAHVLPEVSMLAFHSALPRVVSANYAVGKPIGQNESVFLFSDAANRVSAWRIFMAGGAFHHGTDYSFIRGHEDGSFVVPSGGAGGGGPDLRRQLGLLHHFMNGLDFVHMSPAPTLIRSGVPENAVAVVLGAPGRCYAIHISHNSSIDQGVRPPEIDASMQRVTLELDVPTGAYEVKWINTKTCTQEKSETVAGPHLRLTSPEYAEDLAIMIDAI
jgi:hypothetical protein